MRKLKIDLSDLELAFDSALDEGASYLDLDNGEVVFVTAEAWRELENLYAETEVGTETPPDLLDLAREQNLPDWQIDALHAAAQVEGGFGTRYVAVPRTDSHAGYHDMEDFIETVQDERLQSRLSQAIQGRGAFRRFRDVLAEHRREEQRWYEFRDARERQRIVEWLAQHDIEPVFEPEAERLSEPPARPRLIAEALVFVRAAGRMPGVLRIALIGSLTTDEPDPKDVDMLVTVADEADLEPLAALGRKLQGHAQSIGRGGEVFLADPQGGYLGRICPWKRCGPGFRMSCDAEHCGRRLYLHDDLSTIRLDKRLVGMPPLELWPQVVRRARVAEDVEKELVKRLCEE